MVDYSLLIGIDTTTKTLVVGIVDYCREFSFGLRIYGGVTGGRTIVAPKDYRERFCGQMDRFLMHVPSSDGEVHLPHSLTPASLARDSSRRPGQSSIRTDQLLLPLAGMGPVRE